MNSYALLDDVESTDENGMDNLMNDSDIKFIAEEEITQAASTQDTSLNTPEANLPVVKTDSQSKKKEKNNKEKLWKWTKKVKVTKQEECHLVTEIKPNLNETVEISYLVTGLKELLELMVEQSNFYAHQNGRNFKVTKKKVECVEFQLMEQRTAAYRLDRKSSVRFYLRILFDLMDIACVNSYLIYNTKHPNQLSLLDYKIFVAKNLIQYHQGRKRVVLMSRPSKRMNQPESIDNHGGHLPDY